LHQVINVAPISSDSERSSQWQAEKICRPQTGQGTWPPISWQQRSSQDRESWIDMADKKMDGLQMFTMENPMKMDVYNGKS